MVQLIAKEIGKLHQHLSLNVRVVVVEEQHIRQCEQIMIQVAREKPLHPQHIQLIPNKVHKQFINQELQILSMDRHNAQIFGKIFKRLNRLRRIHRLSDAQRERLLDVVVQHQDSHLELGVLHPIEQMLSIVDTVEYEEAIVNELVREAIVVRHRVGAAQVAGYHRVRIERRQIVLHRAAIVEQFRLDDEPTIECRHRFDVAHWFVVEIDLRSWQIDVDRELNALGAVRNANHSFGDAQPNQFADNAVFVRSNVTATLKGGNITSLLGHNLKV